MVFSSLPIYLHHPFNSEQQPQLQQQLVQQNYPIFHHGSSNINSNNTNNQLLPPPPPNTTGLVGRIGPVLITGSISEAAVKCPRCESTNTKFGYYNNRSLSQPRHFCKNCRRHWTRGGGLRKVPIGGVRRKNKRPKSSSSSKSAATSTSGASSALIRPTNDRHDFGGTVGVLGLNNKYSENGSDIHFSGSDMPDNRFPFMGGSLYGAEDLSNFEFGHVIGSNGLEDNSIANYIGQEDEVGYPN